MGTSDTTGTELRFGINATWGGSKKPTMRANVGVQTPNVGLEIDYNFTDKEKPKKPLPIMGLDRSGKHFIFAEEGDNPYRFALTDDNRVDPKDPKDPKSVARAEKQKVRFWKYKDGQQMPPPKDSDPFKNPDMYEEYRGEEIK
jgi:hypothetical protein